MADTVGCGGGRELGPNPNERHELLVAAAIASSRFALSRAREPRPGARALFRVGRGDGFGSLLVPAIGPILAQRVRDDGAGRVNASLGTVVVAFLPLVALAVLRQHKVPRALEGGAAAAAPDVAMLRGAPGNDAPSWLAILYPMVAQPF